MTQHICKQIKKCQHHILSLLSIKKKTIHLIMPLDNAKMENGITSKGLGVAHFVVQNCLQSQKTLLILKSRYE